MKPDLKLNFERKLASFKLSVQLRVHAEVLVLFGPSGSGKTQTLNSIAGLVEPDEGEIVFDQTTFFRKIAGQARVSLPARSRRVGYVFQNYALFPHLTALENIEFPLRKRSEARTRARDLLSKMHLEDLAGRYPHELSGGQQQRVAIARSLAADSRLLLLDEPFSALDSFIRERLHDELRSLQSESDLVVIYVTHNLDDALAVGNRLAIMREGRIEQAGDIETVLDHPANRSVLEILGLPNILGTSVTGHNDSLTTLDWNGLSLHIPHCEASPGTQMTAFISPNEIRIASAGQNHPNRFNGTVIRKQFGRMATRVIVRLENGCEIEVVPASNIPTIGENISLVFPAERIRMLEG